jgi:hypothetical protein
VHHLNKDPLHVNNACSTGILPVPVYDVCCRLVRRNATSSSHHTVSSEGPHIGLLLVDSHSDVVGKYQSLRFIAYAGCTEASAAGNLPILHFPDSGLRCCFLGLPPELLCHNSRNNHAGTRCSQLCSCQVCVISPADGGPSLLHARVLMPQMQAQVPATFTGLSSEAVQLETSSCSALSVQLMRMRAWPLRSVR